MAFDIASPEGRFFVSLDPYGRTISFKLKSEEGHVTVSIECTLDDLPAELHARFARLEEALRQATPIEGELATTLSQLETIAQRGKDAVTPMVDPLDALCHWLVTNRDARDIDYELTDRSLDHLAWIISAVTGTAPATVRGFMREPDADGTLAAHVAARSRRYVDQHPGPIRFSARVGWYALARALKPKTVVETGAGAGLGGLLIADALLRNRAEGREGRYLGLDIAKGSGYFLHGKPYAQVGRIVVGDAIAALRKMDRKIDLAILDTDSDLEFERAQLLALKPHLAPGGVVISPTEAADGLLAGLAAEMGRRYLYWREEPKNRWHGGRGLAILFGG